MKKTFAVAMLGAAVASGVAVGIPTAHAALSQCPSGDACGWVDANFVGLSVSDNATATKIINQLQDNDTITAIADKGTKDLGWYTDSDLNGNRYCETTNDSNANIGNKWNDQFSSLIVYSTATVC